MMTKQKISDFFWLGLPNLYALRESTSEQVEIITALYERGFGDLIISSADEWAGGTKRPGLHGEGKALDFIVADMKREGHRLFEAFISMSSRVNQSLIDPGLFEWTGGLSLGIREADRHLHVSVMEAGGPSYFLETRQPDENGAVGAVVKQQKPDKFKELLREAATTYGAAINLVEDDSTAIADSATGDNSSNSMALAGAGIGAVWGFANTGFNTQSLKTKTGIVRVAVPAIIGYLAGSVVDKARKEIMEFDIFPW